MDVRFRGKRVDGNGWILGYLFEIIEADSKQLRSFVVPFGSVLSSKISVEKIQVEIIPGSAGQFLHRKDANGTDIYIGDIVEVVTIAEYFGQAAHIRLVYIESFDDIAILDAADRILLKGNAFDNPGLLRDEMLR